MQKTVLRPFLKKISFSATLSSIEPLPPEPSSILVVRLGAIGDVVFSSCLLPALRQAYPKAHLAWLDWRDGKLVAAENNARQALSMWTEDSHPFQWSAHWVLNAIFLAHDQLAGAVESARAMLHPAQQRLPDEITIALEEGVHHWDGGDLNSAQYSLQNAVELANELGYL